MALGGAGGVDAGVVGDEDRAVGIDAQKVLDLTAPAIGPTAPRSWHGAKSSSPVDAASPLAMRSLIRAAHEHFGEPPSAALSAAVRAGQRRLAPRSNAHSARIVSDGGGWCGEPGQEAVSGGHDLGPVGEGLGALREQGFRILALTPAPTATDIENLIAFVQSIDDTTATIPTPSVQFSAVQPHPAILACIKNRKTPGIQVTGDRTLARTSILESTYSERERGRPK